MSLLTLLVLGCASEEQVLEVCNGLDDNGDGRIDETMLSWRSEGGAGDDYRGGLIVGSGVAELVEDDGETVYTRRYDAEGHLLEFISTHGTITYTYDSAGNLILQETDEGNDGTIDSRYELTYDSDGHLLTRSYDQDGDGEDYYRSEWVWQGGLNTEMSSWFVPEERLLSQELYRYDAAENRIEVQSDYDGDGVVDVIDTSTYDEWGREVSRESDDGGDGSVERSFTRIYGGTTAEAFYDHVLESSEAGVVTSRSTNDFLADGQLSLLEDDSDLDGEPDFHWLMTHNADQSVSSAEILLEHPDSGYTRQTVYDYEEGNLISLFWHEVRTATGETSSAQVMYSFTCQ